VEVCYTRCWKDRTQTTAIKKGRETKEREKLIRKYYEKREKGETARKKMQEIEKKN
jgi:hypothetical protein